MAGLSVKEAARILGVQEWLFEGFMSMRGYIQKAGRHYEATGLGVEFGYAKNESGRAMITEKGLARAAKAFA